jgi:hypothetical protein
MNRLNKQGGGEGESFEPPPPPPNLFLDLVHVRVNNDDIRDTLLLGYLLHVSENKSDHIEPVFVNV